MQRSSTPRRGRVGRVRPSAPRPGATLTEVLMSLLIMSIGIVSVIALFPVAILQSIRASQLTNAKILEEDVTEIVRANPELLLAAAPWQPNKSYSLNEYVTPRLPPGSRYPDTNLVFYVANGSDAGTSGILEPNWPRDPSMTRTDNTVTWTADQVTRYVVDQLGRATIDSAFAAEFGNDGTNRDGVLRVDLETTLDLSDLGLTSAQLLDLFELPDSWSVAIEVAPSSVTATSVTVPGSVEISAVNSLFRVVVVSADGTRSAVRSVAAAPTGSTINLSGANLPTDLDSVSEVSVVRIESFTRRYTWMLNVLRDPLGRTRAQCAVIFNRPFSVDSEHAYGYSINAGTNRAQVDVSWASGDPKPLIRPGNYAFDVDSCRWYRIIDVNGSTSPVTVTFDTSLEGDGTVNEKMIFMPGVVSVFDLDL